MEHDVGSLFDLDAPSAGRRLQDFSLLDANSQTFKVRIDNPLVITPSSTLQTPLVHNQNCTSAKQPYFVTQNVANPSQVHQYRDEFVTHPDEERISVDQRLSHVSKMQHEDAQTGFITSLLDVYNKRRPYPGPQLFNFQMCSDVQPAERPQPQISAKEDMHSIHGGDLNRTYKRQDSLAGGNRAEDPSRRRERDHPSLPRLQSNSQTKAASIGLTLPCLPKALLDVGVGQSAGGSSLQQHALSPLHKEENFLPSKATRQMLRSAKKFAMRTHTESSDPSFSFDRNSSCETKVSPILLTGTRQQQRGNGQATRKADGTTKECVSKALLQEMELGDSYPFYNRDISLCDSDVAAQDVGIFPHEQVDVGSSSLLPYDAPITDFEISHGGFRKHADDSNFISQVYSTNDAKSPVAEIDILHRGTLKIKDDAQYVDSGTISKSRARPENGVGNDAPLSRWRQKRRRIDDAAPSNGIDRKSKVEQMKLQRALRNRESARRSRVKSKLQFQNMERKFVELTEENVALTNLVDNLLSPCMRLSPKEDKDGLISGTNISSPK